MRCDSPDKYVDVHLIPYAQTKVMHTHVYAIPGKDWQGGLYRTDPLLVSEYKLTLDVPGCAALSCCACLAAIIICEVASTT